MTNKPYPHISYSLCTHCPMQTVATGLAVPPPPKPSFVHLSKTIFSQGGNFALRTSLAQLSSMHWRWQRGATASLPPALLLVVLVLALVSDCTAAAFKGPAFKGAATLKRPVPIEHGCLPLAIIRFAPRKSKVSRIFTLGFKVSAPSKKVARYWSGNGTSAAVALTALDSGVEYRRISIFPPLRPRQSIAVLDGGQTLLWEDVRLAGRKGRASYSFKAKVKVLPCAPPVLRFRAVLQQFDGCAGPDPVEWTVSH